MMRAELRELLRAEPFQPFTIRLADGRAHPIPHPEYIALSPDSTSAVAYRDGGSFAIIDIPLITSLEVGGRKLRDADAA